MKCSLGQAFLEEKKSLSQDHCLPLYHWFMALQGARGAYPCCGLLFFERRFYLSRFGLSSQCILAIMIRL